jgi:hypothetical protein
MTQRERMQPGLEVLTSDGHALGHVKEVLGNGRYVWVDARFSPDYYIPVGDVKTVRDGKLYLRVTEAQACNRGWEAKPSDDTAMR